VTLGRSIYSGGVVLRARSVDLEAPTDSIGLRSAPVREGRENSAWFHDHFEKAATEVIDFLSSSGIGLTGRDVADVGTGDGIIDLGVALHAKPARLVGFDIIETDNERLLATAQREGVAKKLPPELEFRLSEPTRLPYDDDSFDVVYSWSTFEHVAEPIPLLRDIHRVMRPLGVLMIQLWPLFHSQHGSHLWQYFPEGFVQLLCSEVEIETAVRQNPGPDVEWSERLLDEFRSCNKITLDGLQAALSAAGFRVSKLELTSETVVIPPELKRVPLSLLGISGLKLLATAEPVLSIGG
jgi:SAM-dependent methyltransferase